MKYKVYFISDAEDDLFEICKYISTYDSTEKAEKLLAEFEKACLSLSEYLGRGHTPPELERIGVFEYKEIRWKPYRIIYQVVSQAVYIHAILESRRSLQELLERRLIRE